MELSGFDEFEFDLPGALLTELIGFLETLKSAELTPRNVDGIPLAALGVYQLFHNGVLVYIGKTDADAGLLVRLQRHAKKILHRKNLAPGSVTFKAVRIRVFAAMDLETQLIRHYESIGSPARWNGSGFGANDPGRNRETTNRDPLGFDAQFPIDIDLPLDFLEPGVHPTLATLISLKENLPYLLRFQTGDGRGRYNTNPHADLRGPSVTIPTRLVSLREAMRLVVASLPEGWQATEFASHVILYKEQRDYRFGKVIK